MTVKADEKCGVFLGRVPRQLKLAFQIRCLEERISMGEAVAVFMGRIVSGREKLQRSKMEEQSNIDEIVASFMAQVRERERLRHQKGGER